MNPLLFWDVERQRWVFGTDVSEQRNGLNFTGHSSWNTRVIKTGNVSLKLSTPRYNQTKFTPLSHLVVLFLKELRIYHDS
jgi:hypothetical protein